MRLFQVMFLFLLVSLPFVAILADETARTWSVPAGTLPPV